MFRLKSDTIRSHTLTVLVWFFCVFCFLGRGVTNPKPNILTWGKNLVTFKKKSGSLGPKDLPGVVGESTVEWTCVLLAPRQQRERQELHTDPWVLRTEPL